MVSGRAEFTGLFYCGVNASIVVLGRYFFRLSSFQCLSLAIIGILDKENKKAGI